MTSGRRPFNDLTSGFSLERQAREQSLQNTEVSPLSREAQQQLVDLLLNPPAPNDALQRAFARRQELFGD
jgi:uncharacterized protein (DUF1778 family)